MTRALEDTAVDRFLEGLHEPDSRTDEQRATLARSAHLMDLRQPDFVGIKVVGLAPGSTATLVSDFQAQRENSMWATSYQNTPAQIVLWIPRVYFSAEKEVHLRIGHRDYEHQSLRVPTPDAALNAVELQVQQMPDQVYRNPDGEVTL